MTRILLVSGSTADMSVQTAALRTVARCAPDGMTVTRYDGLRGLPAFVPGERPVPEAVVRLRQQVGDADAVVFSTPEYAGSLPGALKNLLDHLVAGGELGGKPVAWLSVSAPGHDDGARAALETVLGHGNARLLRAVCVRVPLVPQAVDEYGYVTDPQLHLASLDMLGALSRSLTDPRSRPQPSWQAYSSLYPQVQRSVDRPSFGTGGSYF